MSRNFFITAELFQQTPPRPERSFPSKAGNRTTAWSENRRNLPVQFPPKAKRSPGWMTAYSGSGYERNVCDVSKSPLAASAVWAHFACGKNRGNLLRLSTPKSFQRQKRKTTQFGWFLAGAGYERNVCDVSKSPLAALALWAVFCLRQKPREPASPLRPLNLFSGKKEKPPDFGWLFWSRLRGSNSLPPPWQGGALPDELNLHTHHRNDVIFGASDRNRTNDTRIFSPLLYRLSYRGGWRPVSGSNRRPLA